MSILKEELERSRAQIEEMKLQLNEKHQEESRDRDYLQQWPLKKFYMVRLNDIQREKFIGSGSTAQVYKGTYKE